ncbi:hypothetical protein NQ315_012992 [Exocentrus adspersus]|uniref:Exostosin-like protein n=1 Tax=Exocentrus adspersus TaxID=1586481 RepID=A0AAV8VRP4_9CUCU|nr:hypothetical protein NQ315_012992 [Exocentrus adspersus]
MVINSDNNDICQWLIHVKLSRIVIMVLAILILTPLITHFYLSKVERGADLIEHNVYSHKNLPEDINAIKLADLKIGLAELLKIRGSVLSELRDIEQKRQQYKIEMQGYSKDIEELRQELSHQQSNLNRLKISIEQAQVAQKEALQQNTPELILPKSLTADALPLVFPPLPRNLSWRCRMFSCFDHSRCSLTSGFPVYLYDPDKYPVMHTGWDVDGFLKTTLKQTLGYNSHLTGNPKKACIYLVLVGEALKNSGNNEDEHIYALDGEALKRLPYWGGDGRNHVLLNLARRDLMTSSGDIFSSIDTGMCK